MEKAITTLFILFLGVCVFAQSDDGSERNPIRHREKKNYCAPLYFVLSTGINNNTGFTGISADVPVSAHISLEGGVGLSTWGTKYFVGGKYFLNSCHLGWAFGTGITANSYFEVL